MYLIMKKFKRITIVTTNKEGFPFDALVGRFSNSPFLSTRHACLHHNQTK